MEGQIPPTQIPPGHPPATYPAGLHSVRKPPTKPWRRPEPPPPRVYRVDPRGFRQLVQRLTGTPRPPRPMTDRAPPPTLYLPALHAGGEVAGMTPASNTGNINNGEVLSSPSLLSAYTTAWFGFPILSPGTTAALEFPNNALL